MREIRGDRQPFEVLIVKIGNGELTAQQAIELVRAAQLMPYANSDTARFGVGGTMVGLSGQIALRGEGVWFGPNSFTGLHRHVYEEALVANVPASMVAKICLEAVRRIKYATGEFSFCNALAYLAEKQSDREEAVRVSYPLHEIVEKSQQTGFPMFIEAFIPCMKTEAEPGSTLVGKVLWDTINNAKKNGDQQLEFRGWRSLALYHCEIGDATSAIDQYGEAIRCAHGFLEPTPLLNLLGDCLVAALNCQDEATAQKCARKISELAGIVPHYIACAALLTRTALLCRQASAVSEADKCSAAAERCAQ